MELYEAIKPRPDLKDYYGNLPLFYAVMQNDVVLVKKLYKPHKEYFTLTNYKHQTIFHVAAKKNSLEALKVLVDSRSFFEELIKKDYKGDTPLHLAQRRKSKEVMDFFMTQAQEGMLDIQNDFCLTAA